MIRRPALVAVAGCLLLTAAGCPAAGDGPTPAAASSGPSSSGASSSGPSSSGGPVPASRATEATTDRPAYRGPPPGAPATTGPALRLQAAVDLLPASPGVFAAPESAVETPDGRVHVVLTPVAGGLPQQLATVAGSAVTGSVPMPPFAEVWGTHLLADGAVVVAGRLRPAERRAADVGFAVVDPRTGTARTAVAVPVDEQVRSVIGRSALSADGRTLTLFVSTTTAGQARTEELLAVDVGTGAVTARRGLGPSVTAVSAYPAGPEVAGLVARPGGGATLVFDASPTGVRPDRIPTLLSFGPGLEPDGPAVRLTDLAERADAQAVTFAADGTLFLTVEVPDGVWLLAVPDGGGAGPVLAVVDDAAHDYALVVEPAQVWALLPALPGLRAVDLTTGEPVGPLDLGCPAGLHVRQVLPRSAGAGALLIGECGPPAMRAEMLWIVGP